MRHPFGQSGGAATSPSLSPAVLKSAEEIDAMRAAGAVAGETLNLATFACRPGARTADVDAVVRASLARLGAEVLFEGYRQGDSPAFTGACCVSVNDEVVHGVPGERRLRPGDLVTVDVGLRLGAEGEQPGWCADAARTVVVAGEPEADSAIGRFGPDNVARLLSATRETLDRAIAAMRPGVRWSEIASMMEQMASERGFGVVDEYVGHGLGRDLHEPPQAPACIGTRSFRDFTLKAGMTLAIEPILTLSHPAQTGVLSVSAGADGWTVSTSDGSLACHEEDTVAVLEGGCAVLTAGGGR